MNKILIVEDEEAIAALIRMNLTKAGYQCDLACSGDEGADKLSENNYDLCLLDIMLPGINGYELLSYAKSLEVPVIFVTAKGTTEDKVKGLKSGADDYITKPFEVLELLARVENVLRRFNKTGRYINIAGLNIDTTARIVKRDGTVLKLTYKEFDLLLLFARNPGTARIWVTAGQLTCMCKGCARKRGLRGILKRYIKLDTGLCQGKIYEVILEIIYNNVMFCNSSIYGIWKYNYKYTI